MSEFKKLEIENPAEILINRLNAIFGTQKSKKLSGVAYGITGEMAFEIILKEIGENIPALRKGRREVFMSLIDLQDNDIEILILSLMRENGSISPKKAKIRSITQAGKRVSFEKSECYIDGFRKKISEIFSQDQVTPFRKRN